MRALFALPLLLAALPAGPLGAQEVAHVAVEATSLVVDAERLRRVGAAGVIVADPASGAGVAAGRAGNVRIAARPGGLEVAAWLDLVRRERAVQRESTQRIVVLSGSPAQISGQQRVVGRFGQEASAGPALWVEPVALEDGSVRLRLWSTIGEVRPGPYGSVRQEVQIEASTEVVVPPGGSVLVASHELRERSSERGVLSRTRTSREGQAWIVVSARVVEDAARAFQLPAARPE
jgi:hypothetical protein